MKQRRFGCLRFQKEEPLFLIGQKCKIAGGGGGGAGEGALGWEEEEEEEFKNDSPD